MIYFIKYQIENPELLIATLAFIVSIIGLFLSIRALHIQRRHNQLSLVPFGRIILGDYGDEIFVKLANCGVGPLIINRVLVSNSVSSSNNLIDLVDIDRPRGLEWKDFVEELENRVIKIDDELLLVEITGLDKPRTMDDVDSYEKFQSNLRSLLSGITISFEYRDVYNNNFVEIRRLTWFGRNVEKIA